MTKKKSFWTAIVAFCLIVPAMFVMTACKKDKHKHTFSTEWTKTEEYHWYEATCEHSDEKDSYGTHVYDNDDDRDCNICGYVRAMANQITFNTFDERTYNKTAQPLKASEYNIEHEAGEVVVEYKLKNAEDSTYSTDAPVKAGQYTVRVTAKKNETYKEASNTNDFIIKPYVLNEAKGHHTKEYDGDSNVLKPFEIFEGDRIRVQMVMTSKNVGASLYQAVINGIGNTNYQLPENLDGMSAEITAKKLKFNTTNMTKVYDGTANYRYNFTTADGLVKNIHTNDECYVSFNLKVLGGDDCIDAGYYSSVISSSNQTLSNTNYVIDVAYSKYGDLESGENTKLTITKRKINNLNLSASKTDVPIDSTGVKTLEFTIDDSCIVARDAEKVIVKVTFDSQVLTDTTYLELTTEETYNAQQKARIEFNKDEYDAYKNYEFDTENLGNISREN